MSRPTWADHAMNIALASAARSEDPHCKVGACVLDKDGIVLGVGYNGTIAGASIDWNDRQGRRPYVIHGEANALRYTTPTLARGGILAVTHFPCSPCVLLAASYGIEKVYWLHAPDWERYPDAPTIELAEKLGLDLWHIIGSAR